MWEKMQDCWGVQKSYSAIETELLLCTREDEFHHAWKIKYINMQQVQVKGGAAIFFWIKNTAEFTFLNFKEFF